MRAMTVMQLLPALEGGGVERSTLEIGEALVRAGHRSIVVSAGGRLLQSLRMQGSEHITWDIGRKSLRTLGHVCSLKRLFAELQPDIVHARSRLPAWLAYQALRGMAGSKPHFVTTVHGLNSPGMYSGIMTRGERVVCVSQTVRTHVLRHWPKTDPGKLVVIEPGIDPDAFPKALTVSPEYRRQWSAEFSSLVGGKLLLMPGRGTRLKGHTAAIQLLAALRQQGVDARLWLLGAREAGREAYLRELTALAQSLGVAAFVVISEPRAEIAQAYALSDLVLQLSEKPEAFGRTVLEALSVGKPVLGWGHGGVGELLSRYFPEGSVAYGDRPALEAAAQRLLHHPGVLASITETLQTTQMQTLKVYESLAR